MRDKESIGGLVRHITFGDTAGGGEGEIPVSMGLSEQCAEGGFKRGSEGGRVGEVLL
jgi:hypothetical protein